MVSGVSESTHGRLFMSRDDDQSLPKRTGVSEAMSNRAATIEVPQLVLKRVLKDLLKESGLTAAALSRKCGVPRSVLSDWMAGSRPRNVQQLKCVADHFGVSLEWLCFGRGHHPAGDELIEGVFEGRLRLVRRK